MFNHNLATWMLLVLLAAVKTPASPRRSGAPSSRIALFHCSSETEHQNRTLYSILSREVEQQLPEGGLVLEQQPLGGLHALGMLRLPL